MVKVKRSHWNKRTGSSSSSSCLSFASCAFYLILLSVAVLVLETLVEPESYSAIIERLENYSSIERQADNNNSNNNKTISNRIQPHVETTVIAYAVVITGCASTVEFPLEEVAAILHHSIRKQHNATAGGGAMSGASRRYGYKMYAIYHPEAESCARGLEQVGFHLLKRETFVAVEDIQGAFLKEKIVENGCCGEKELLKLEAFTLTEHPLVVLLDLDVLILKPLDALFDFILERKRPPDEHLQWPSLPLPAKIDLIYTLDYYVVAPKKKIKPVQGGFVVLRPNVTVYNDLQAIVREGDYRNNGGWGGKTGKFWGSMTFQGLIPFYFFILHPGRVVEMNPCVYNNMAWDPLSDPPSANVSGRCLTDQDECEDCRRRSIESVYSTHFTICQKPWMCLIHDKDTIEDRLCGDFHHEWFKTRSELELLWGRAGQGDSSWHSQHFLGFCMHFGKKGYVHMKKPYGSFAAPI